MINNSHNQRGNTHITIVLAIIITLLGVVGCVFWHNLTRQEPSIKSGEVASIKDDSKKEDITKQQTYALQDAIDDIYKVISDEACEGMGVTKQSLNFTQVPEKADFTGKNVINHNLTHAYVTYGCGSQGVVALLMKDKDSWILLNEDARMYPMCAVVRGQNFPSSVVDKCYENDKSTEPENI